jgi:hypothetical protein
MLIKIEKNTVFALNLPLLCKFKHLFYKKKSTLEAGGMIHAIDSLPSKCEAEFKPQYHQKKKKNRIHLGTNLRGK